MYFSKPCDGPLSDGHIAVFVALALMDQDQAAVEREVVEFQTRSSPAPQAGRVEHLEDGAVAQADGLVDVAAAA